MTVVAIVQARLGSERLPGKVLKKIGNQTSIHRQIERLRKASTLDSVVLATTQLDRDDPLVAHAVSLDLEVYRGPEGDVLSRYVEIALELKPELIVRITGDCPLIDPGIVDDVVAIAKTGKSDYYSNVEPPTYPKGLDVEVFPIASLLWASKNTFDIKDREHVTTELRRSSIVRRENLEWSADFSSERWTLDTQDDLEVITNVFQAFSWKNDFSWLEVMELMSQSPELFAKNRYLAREEGHSTAPQGKAATHTGDPEKSGAGNH
jgi:glutamate-1-semialdehyde 2,1-aminomutase